MTEDKTEISGSYCRLEKIETPKAPLEKEEAASPGKESSDDTADRVALREFDQEKALLKILRQSQNSEENSESKTVEL